MVKALDSEDALAALTADEAAIIAVIGAETAAFTDSDFDAWAACWVQEPRAQSVCMSSSTGLSEISGWTGVAADMRHVLDNDLGCRMQDCRQDNFRITIEGRTAWTVFDQFAEDINGATWETFETRILEREETGWKIVYSAFVEKRSDHTERDAVTVDKTGHVLWASQDNLERLRGHPHLTVSAGRVRGRRLDWDRALQQAVAHAGRYHGYFQHRRFAADTGGSFRYPAILGDTDEGGVAVVPISVRDGATYLHIDGDGSLTRRLAVAQAVFGLSDGQVRVAGLIASGLGLKAVADDLGISVNTARTHLSRLYEKTGVSSQTALVRLLLSMG